MKPAICLNMIVKNEGDRIERAFNSVLPYVKSVVVYDTGSTDDTIEIIAEMCRTFDISYLIESGEFRDFGYARNKAWQMAKNQNGKHLLPWCQFALMMDADMELVVDAGYNFEDLDARSPGYDLMQKGGSVSYANRRLVNLQVEKEEIYVGVTHEYIDVASGGMISKARFTDYADGSNRKDKYIRDAQLLEAALKDDPDNGRYLYYLGQTYKDWGSTDKTVLPYAADAFDKRIKLGGWDEETHAAMTGLAEVQKMRKNDAQFVKGMIEAYNFRPQRAEPLHAVAQYYREKGQNHASLLFSKAGLKTPRPNDLLFVDDFVYEHGLRFEYSIAGYSAPEERDHALQVTDDLALDPTCPEPHRHAARRNLYWYTKPLGHYCPSFVDQKIVFFPPEGYTAMNPSVEVHNGQIKCNVRAVNYKIDERGRYMIGPKECHDAPIDTRNFILTLDERLDTYRVREIIWHRPQAKFPLVTGLEDIRLYRHNGKLYFNACVREQAGNGTCQQWRGRLDPDLKDDDYILVADDGPMSEESAIEKNWMPITDTQSFVYRPDTIIYPDRDSPRAVVSSTKVEVHNISGGSQLIPFRHGHLCVVHEAETGPDGKRTYWHRFAWFNMDYELRRLSLPFVFLDKQIEFCAGLAAHPNGTDLILSYGVRDAEAHLARVNIEEVAQMIWKFYEN